MTELTDLNVDLTRAILWQYENAEKLKALVLDEQRWTNENVSDFWARWYRDVFNLETANEFGMSVWARILDVPLSFAAPSSRGKAAFGFGANHLNFGNGNFARDRETELGLTLDQSRLVLRMRYYQLTTRPTVTRINEVLKRLFGDQGDVFVFDPLDMSWVVYFFNFEPDSNLRLILEKFDLLPRPSTLGVKWQVQIRPAFGFGPNHLNFENGSFGS